MSTKIPSHKASQFKKNVRPFHWYLCTHKILCPLTHTNTNTHTQNWIYNQDPVLKEITLILLVKWCLQRTIKKAPKI